MKSDKKVLIAEDELLIAKVLRMQLEKHGFEVENVIDTDDTNITNRLKIKLKGYLNRL